MNFIIRSAIKSDFPRIHELIQALARFEKAEHLVTNSPELMLEEMDYFECLVAEHPEDQSIVGIAVFFYCYYTWVGKSLYLDDLYVIPEFRKMGLGKQLLDQVLSIAREQNCKRVRWQVLDWNTDAIKFYERIGAEISEEWLNCSINQS